MLSRCRQHLYILRHTHTFHHRFELPGAASYRHFRRSAGHFAGNLLCTRHEIIDSHARRAANWTKFAFSGATPVAYIPIPADARV